MNWRLAGAVIVPLVALGAPCLVVQADCWCEGDDCYEDVIVSGAGTEEINGTYQFDGMDDDGYPIFYAGGGRYLFFCDSYDGSWHIAESDTCMDDMLYGNNESSSTPPSTGWDVMYGDEPAPTVSGGWECGGASIAVSAISGDTTEAGGTATFTLTPDPAPAADVTVPLLSSDTGEGTVPASVVLPSGSAAAVTVTVTGIDDDVADGDIGYTIYTGDPTSADSDYNDLGSDDVNDVSVTNVDDDVAGITVDPTSGLTTTEAGGQDTFTVVLDTEPTDTVTIGISSSDPSEGTAAPAALTFTTGDWDTPQTVTVTGVDDDVDDGDIGYTIVTAAAAGGDYAGIDAADVSVSNTDDDTKGVTVDPTSGLTTTEAGGQDTFTVVLDSEPTDTVTIGISSDDPSEGMASPATLTFTPGDWDQSQTVTVTGVDDLVDDGARGYTLVVSPAAGGDYTGIDGDDVGATNMDNDAAGITVSPADGLLTTEAGGIAVFDIFANTQPMNDVIVSLLSSDPSEGTIPASVTLPAGSMAPVTITVTGIDDDEIDGDVVYTIVTGDPTSGDGKYDLLTASDVMDVGVINRDDDVALQIIPSGAAGPGEFLDVVLPVAEGESPPMAGARMLAAVHAVGDLVGGGVRILDADGASVWASFVHICVYSVDIETVPEAQVLMNHWCVVYDWELDEYPFVWDTTDFAPGYYDLYLLFAGDIIQVFRIELIPPV